jgi:hypothetical protein
MQLDKNGKLTINGMVVNKNTYIDEVRQLVNQYTFDSLVDTEKAFEVQLPNNNSELKRKIKDARSVLFKVASEMDYKVVTTAINGKLYAAIFTKE